MPNDFGHNGFQIANRIGESGVYDMSGHAPNDAGGFILGDHVPAQSAQLLDTA
jgi:hypothetical protein